MAGLCLVWAATLKACAIPIIGAPALMGHAPPPAAPVQPEPVVPAEPAPLPAPPPAVAQATAPATATAAAPVSPLLALSLSRPAPTSSCAAKLRAAGVVFEPLDGEATRGVEQPIRVTGTLGGVRIKAHAKEELHGILDCRLALALLRWSPALRRAGVVTLEHYSVYRPGARTPRKGQVSGHARALAIDAARFHMADGTTVDVLEDWQDHDRGEAPCPVRPDEARGARILRNLVCDAVDHALFQVVLTPHHDKAHHNHVHLELKPEVTWTYVR